MTNTDIALSDTRYMFLMQQNNGFGVELLLGLFNNLIFKYI